jgi:hypothetical protein
MNGINIPTAEDILSQNGYVQLRDFAENPVRSTVQEESIEENALRIAREKLEQQRELKRRVDRLVQQVLG